MVRPAKLWEGMVGICCPCKSEYISREVKSEEAWGDMPNQLYSYAIKTYRKQKRKHELGALTVAGPLQLPLPAHLQLCTLSFL